MSIDKRGPNKFRFRIQYQGFQYTRMFYGNERESKKEHEKFKHEVKSGKINLKSEMTYSEFAQIFYDEYVKTLRFGTQQIYKNNINNHIMPVIGNLKLKDLTTFTVQQMINSLKKEFKPNTVRGIYSCLARSMNYAVKWGFIEKNPCAFIELPRAKQLNMSEIYSIEDIKKLIELYENETNLMHKAAFYLAIGCGLRNSEIRALTLDDIDLKNNTVTVDKQIGKVREEKGMIVEEVVEPKTATSNRTLYMPDFVTDVVKAYIQSMKYTPISKLLFYSHINHKPISSHCLSKRFTQKLSEAGLPQIRFHDLRHLHATLLIHSGANLQATAKRMGHSSIKTTIQTYIHSMEDIDRTTSDSLDEKFKEITNKNKSCPIVAQNKID